MSEGWDEEAAPFAPVVLEGLPRGVAAALEVRDRWRQRAARSGAGLEFLVTDLGRWPVGATLRVAFLDGDTDLHRAVAEATRPITDAGNITLDFGFDEATGYRRWSTTDQVHAAEIRVSFDLEGYWSLVGTDSDDPTIGLPGGPDGGRPGQRSLNLEGFASELPDGWEGTTRHEFLHALGFHHEHQNLAGPCQVDFRWEDDPGYTPTQFQGVFQPDRAGRRPGIYTYLSGAPNGWTRAMVDHNLRASDEPGLTAGRFDPHSVMLYRFPDHFYATPDSLCRPAGDGQMLSDGDVDGLRFLYPEDDEAVADVGHRAEVALASLVGTGEEEAAATGSSAFAERAAAVLRSHTA